MDSYINDAGKVVVIADMPTNYLFNAYFKHKKKLESLNSVLTGKNAHVASVIKYRDQIKEVFDSICAEIGKRGMNLPVDN